jgi:hypothetical protein
MAGLQKYWIVGAAAFGIATAALGIVMLFIFPSQAELSQGFRSPIIAFEFANTEDDLAFLSGSSETSRTNRQKMNEGHRWDMVFPFAYAGFVTLLLLQLVARGQRWLWLAIPVALLIIPFDIRENLVLLAITSALSDSTSAALLLPALYVATWLKWGALGLSIGALAVGYTVEKHYFSAAVSAFTAAGIAACWVSGAEPVIAEAMSAATSLFFFYFTVKACVLAWKTWRPDTGPTRARQSTDKNDSAAQPAGSRDSKAQRAAETLFLSASELAAGVDDIRASPRDHGVVRKIVCRPDISKRKELEEARLDPALGLEGDNWLDRSLKYMPDRRANPDTQLNLMNARAIALIARSDDRWQLAGDQFFVDLDLSPANLPPGTRLQLGEAVIEVTAEPHLGCSKFKERFGRDAAQFVNSEIGKSLNLRGINARIVQGGTVRVESTVRKVAR